MRTSYLGKSVLLRMTDRLLVAPEHANSPLCQHRSDSHSPLFKISDLVPWANQRSRERIQPTMSSDSLKRSHSLFLRGSTGAYITYPCMYKSHSESLVALFISAPSSCLVFFIFSLQIGLPVCVNYRFPVAETCYDSFVSYRLLRCCRRVLPSPLSYLFSYNFNISLQTLYDAPREKQGRVCLAVDP